MSADVLEAVARALQLDDTERAHLMDLARPRQVRRRRRPAAGEQAVRPGVQWLLDAQATPAFVLGRRMDVLATNAMARALLCDFDGLEPRERNHARWVFLNPLARERYVDWEAIARENVASLRLFAGQYPDDPALTELIGELTVKSPEFSRWWSEHDVLQRSHGIKRYRHPIAGELEIHYEALVLSGDADQLLFIYSVEPGSVSARGLDLLASWIAEPFEPGPARPAADAAERGTEQ